MRKVISYVIVFIIGFAVCAALLQKWFVPRSEVGGLMGDRMSVRAGLPIAAVGSNAVAAAAAKVGKSVVNIDTRGHTLVREAPFGMPGFLAPPPFGVPYPTVGAASGVIIRSDGYILTNNHVVQGTESIKVTLHDGKTQYDGRIVGADPSSDLAVIKVNARNLPVAKFGDSDTLAVGDWVIAIGNPLRFGPTVTAGVVSAVGRNLDNRALVDAIQTDAAINQGNSGGALADINGNVVGINTAIAQTQPGGGNIGIGFAIPSNTAKRVSEELIKHGKIVRPREAPSIPREGARPWMGIMYRSITNDDRDAMAAAGLKPPRGGVAIIQMAIGSPAQQAGLGINDIILEAGRKPINNSDDLASAVRGSKVGQKIPLLVWRNGQTWLVTVKLGQMPAGLE